MTAVVKDMGLSVEEFFRSLPVAMDGLAYRIEGLRVESGTPEHGLSIRIEPRAPRVLGGMMALPRSRVTITFHGYDQAQRDRFLDDFVRAYHRGGG